MKKIVFMAVLLLLSLSAAPQSYYGYDDDVVYSAEADDDYTYDVANGLDLTGDQWHTNEVSILGANNSQYIVVRGPSRYLCRLIMFNTYKYEKIWRHRISLYRPYYYNGSLGWYVVAGLINYFIYPDGHWCQLSYEPYYYPYRYHIAHCRRINFHDWHFWHGRHHQNYHGTCYHPRKPVPHRSYGNSYDRNPRYHKQVPARNGYEGRSQHRYSEQQRRQDRNVSRETRRPTEQHSVRNNNSSNRRNHYAPANRNRPSRATGSETRSSGRRGDREYSRGRGDREHSRGRR